MAEFERYTLETTPRGARITFDQRKAALTNLTLGLAAAVAVYVLDGPAPIMWFALLYAGFAALALRSEERTTEIDGSITYRSNGAERSIPRDRVVELSLRLRRERKGKGKKETLLPWSVEIRDSHTGKPFSDYAFQKERVARDFAARLGDLLGLAPVEYTERPTAS